MPPPLRIAIVAACPFTLRRGTPVRIQRTAEALAERGHEVHVITYHLGDSDFSPLLHVHRTPDDPSYTKLSPGPTFRKLFVVDRALHRLLRRLLREKPFDVIHAHHYEGLLVSASARRGMQVPLVYDAHTLLMSELPFYRLGGAPTAMKRFAGEWLDSKVPGLADHTVCVTDTIRDKLIRVGGCTPENISVISNGVEFEHFDTVVQSLKIPHDGRTLIYTGNMAEYQGVDLMLRAFAHVAARKPDARLVIATDSSFAPYETLARQLKVYSHIQFVDSPKFSDLPGILAGAAVAVNPRKDGDGVPVKMLNYMAASRAVVSFEGSAPGVVHGRTGWLAPSGDTEAFAQGLLTLLADPALAVRMGSEARQYVLENCRWSIAAERSEVLYRKLMGSNA